MMISVYIYLLVSVVRRRLDETDAEVAEHSTPAKEYSLDSFSN